MNRYLEQLRSAIETATRGMTPHELTLPVEGRWNAAQVLEHLSLTYSGTTRGFRRCLDAGHPLAGSVGFKQRLRILLVVDLGYFPKGREAPNGTRPKGTLGANAVQEIGRSVAEMDSAIEQCEARHGRRVLLLDHPVLGPLTADQWRKFHLVHAKHHMKQIEELRRV